MVQARGLCDAKTFVPRVRADRSIHPAPVLVTAVMGVRAVAEELANSRKCLHPAQFDLRRSALHTLAAPAPSCSIQATMLAARLLPIFARAAS